MLFLCCRLVYLCIALWETHQCMMFVISLYEHDFKWICVKQFMDSLDALLINFFSFFIIHLLCFVIRMVTVIFQKIILTLLSVCHTSVWGKCLICQYKMSLLLIKKPYLLYILMNFVLAGQNLKTLESSTWLWTWKNSRSDVIKWLFMAIRLSWSTLKYLCRWLETAIKYEVNFDTCLCFNLYPLTTKDQFKACHT